MKKHVFKRITAMVLIGVMCVLLMPTNSLGVKAVSTDDVLVDGTQVSLGIDAENPALETDLVSENEEDEISEETENEDISGTESEDVSDNTEDVNPEDVEDEFALEEDASDELLVENENIIMAGNTVGEWTLEYDDVTEIYDSFGEVSARIDELNNPEGVYLIMPDSESEDYIVFDEAFPTVAAEVCIMSKYYKRCIYTSRLEADYKVTITSPMELMCGGKIKELDLTDSLFVHSSVAGDTMYIETLTISHRICTSTRVKVETCNLKGLIHFFLNYSYTDYVSGETVYSTEGMYDITTINYYEYEGDTWDCFSFNVDEGYELGHVGFTTSTVITHSNVYQDMTAPNIGEIVKNADKTYSIVWTKNEVPQYLLSYNNKVEKYRSYYDVVNRINELNDNSKVYTIKVADERWDSTSVGYWPSAAKKLIIEASNREKSSRPLDNSKLLYLSGTVDKYPIETKGWTTIRINSSATIADLKCLDTDMTFEISTACKIEKLTLNSSTTLDIADNVKIGTLAYQYKSSYTEPLVKMSYHISTWTEKYICGTLNIDTLTVASGIKGIHVSVDTDKNMIDTPILEIANCNSSLWKLVRVSVYDAQDGYTVVKDMSESGSHILQWQEDATTKIKLRYGETEETFNTLEQVMARIESINDATNDYTVTISVLYDGLGELKITDLPTAANSLTMLNETGSKQTLIIKNRNTPELTYSLAFVDYDVELVGDDLSTSGDITIKGKTRSCSLYTKYDFKCSGTMSLDGIDNVYIGDLLRAQTLQWSPFNATTAKTNCFKEMGKIIVTNLEIADGYKMNLVCERFNDDEVYMTVSNYSEDCLRVNMICNHTDEDGNVYEGVMKVSGKYCTYQRAIVPAYYYVTDSEGNTFINSNSWIDVQNAFNKLGDKNETYIIQVENGKTIGALPTKAGKIILTGMGELSNSIITVIRVNSATLDAKVNLTIQNAQLEYGTNMTPVNIKMTSKELMLNNVTNIGTITGNSGELKIYKTVNIAKIDKVKDLTIIQNATLNVSGNITNITNFGINGVVYVAKIDKVNNLTIENQAELTVSGNMTNITNLGIKDDLYVWGDVSITNICSDSRNAHTFNYDVTKKLTISGTISSYEGTAVGSQGLRIYPYQNGSKMQSFAEDTVIIDSCPKAIVADIYLANLDSKKALYRSGNTVKAGAYKIVLFENYAKDWVNAKYTQGTTFVTVNDAIEHINRRTEGDFVIRLEENIPSAGTIKTINGTGKTLTIGSYEGESRILNFTGTFTVDGGNVAVKDVALCNSATANASVTLKNGAVLTLCDTAINALTAPAGTKVIIANDADKEVDVTIAGTAKCLGDLVMEEGSVLWCKSALTTGNFTAEGSGSELRILSGKAFAINGTVTISESSPLCINYVDKNGNLATVKSGATMVTAANGKAGQFTTENLMTGTTDVCWLLTKSGKVIKTSGTMAYVYVKDNRQAVNPEFAGFNEAKEYIATKAGDGEQYVIELVCSTSGADLSDLPSNLVAIVKSENAAGTSVKITTSLDVTLSADLVLDGVNLSAAKKTINANDYELYIDNNGGITAERAKELSTIIVNSGTVTFTAKDSTINNVEMGPDGTFKCPQFTGFAMG